jgi:hypothetical protein
LEIILKGKREAYKLLSILIDIPTLYVATEKSECPDCRVKLLIQKVEEARTIFSITFSKINTREYIYYCPCCNKVFHADAINSLVKPGCNFSYDCLVETGKLRYLEKRQISEIKQILYKDYDIPISTTHVRRLCYQFLLYLGRFHYSNVSQINKIMLKRGGYVLHIDSTCEGRKPHLLTCIDSLGGYILYSQKINGENEVELTIIFQKVKQLFGIPLAVVHDMGAGINKAGAVVFKGVPQVICHFHLLRDIGKDLFEAEYRTLQKQLSKKKIYHKVRYQIKMLENEIGSKKDAEKLLLSIKSNDELSHLELLQGILYGYLLSLKCHENSGDGYGLPFDCSKLRYYYKIVEIYQEIETLESKNFSWKNKDNSRLYQIKDILRKVTNDKSLRRNVKKLEDKIKHFDELRKIMRIALPDEKNGLNDSGKIEKLEELSKMEKQLRNFVNKLKNIVDEAPSKTKQIKGVINQLEKYWDKIFAKPIIVYDGNIEKIIIPQRTNNISEQFYRKMKQLFRRLHGRRHVGKDILFLPEEIALIENLKNDGYINELLDGSIDTLPKMFAQLDANAVELPFEKEKLDVLVPQKILNFLKNFKPIERIDFYMKKAA